ncbi:hypothetical protein D3C81_1426870 [compost metagenome]
MGFLVYLHHCHDVLAIGVEQRNVVLDEQLLRWGHELLLGAGLFEAVVAGRDPHFVLERPIQVVIALNQLARERRIARPDHCAVRGIDIGQQHVWQMRDMVEEFAAGLAPRHGVNAWQRIQVCPRVQQLAHGAHIGDRHMSYFSVGDRGNELRGKQRVTLDAFFDDETAGYQPQTGGHRQDDGQADPGVPTQEVERLARCASVRAGG